MTRTTKRVLLYGPLVLAVAVIGGGLVAWRMMTGPLYRPGMVRAGESLRAPLEPPTQPEGAERWLVEPDIELHHFTVGTGRPALFIHGGPGFPPSEAPSALALLGESFEVHLYDQRGCGRSTRPIERFVGDNFYQNMLDLDRTLGLGAQIADIERIRRILGQDKLILIGHSFGGFLATLYATEFPERVAALVLIAPADLVVFPAEHANLFDLIKEKLPPNETAGYDEFIAQYFDFASLFEQDEQTLSKNNREFARYFLMATQAPPEATTQPSLDLAGGWMVHAMYLSMGLHHDYREAVQAIRTPTLILHGGEDLVPEAASRSYAKLIAGAEFKLLPNSGHMIFEDQPAEFAAAVGAFLSGVEE